MFSLTAGSVNGSGKRVRSGAQALTLLSAHRNVLVLEALAGGPRRQAELRRIAGLPAQTTLRALLKGLEQIGAIGKHRRNAFPGTLEYGLEKPGEELLFVVVALERWLAQAPGTPIELGSDTAKAAIKALVEAWSASMLRALAAKPLSLTELDRLIAELNYPSLERRLGGMRIAGLVEALPGNGRGTPYAVTEWLRRGMAPLTAAIRWERHHIRDRTAPLGQLDVEAGFLLMLPLLRLPSDVDGQCRMAVELPNGSKRQLAGVIVELRAGKISSCTSRLEGTPAAWMSGSAAAWLAAAIEADTAQLELGGDCRLARALLDGIHTTLFAPPSMRPHQFQNETD
jgi:DNA-binding HxlR family transcriptional regulator